MKDDYSKEIHLQCATCGGEDYFETDKDTGVITCKKCNRKYYGGYDELVNLNQKRIEMNNNSLMMSKKTSKRSCRI